jgi:flagella basal body P-ring formation protein FlgA
MRNLLPLVLSICISPITANVGEAAVLRSSTTLYRSEVRVADLFDDAGPAAERILGQGPAPGGRIVVEAAQAAAIARQFGVSWRPNSGAERVVLDRPGRTLPREEILATLHRALRHGGSSDDADIELASFSAPMVPPDSHADLTVEQLDVDPGSGRFTAGLAIAVDGEPLQRLHLSGQLQEMVDAVVATHRLAAGSALGEADVALQRIPAAPNRTDAARSLSQVIGQALQHPVHAGQTLPLAELGRPVLVRKGALVQMLLQAPGLAMTASGEAVEAGGLGDHIGVLNPVSGAIVEARIIAADQVQVLPGASLRRPARAGSTLMSQR